MNTKIKILLVGLAVVCTAALGLAFQLNANIKALRNEFAQKQQEFQNEKQNLGQQLAAVTDAKKKMDAELRDLTAKFDSLTKDRDSLKDKFDLVSKERATLVEKLLALGKDKNALEAEVAKLKSGGGGAGAEMSTPVATPTDDAYWANLLREKASLEIQVKQLNEQVNEARLRAEGAMEEGRKIDLQYKTVTTAKGDLERRLIYNEKLAETLSEDLVREKRDKKAVLTQLETLRQENFELKSRLMAIGDKKTLLETKVVDLQQEREILSKRLAELDSILQDRVDQIIQVKDDLKAVRDQAKDATTMESRVVQLQPIVVKASEEASAQRLQSSKSGQVLAVNEENNFVIIDMGETAGIKVGQSFTIFRNGQKIAVVEVIQIRKEISAADIKNVTSGSKIKVGDAVS